MIIWSGFGFLVAIIVFGCSLAMELITEGVTGNEEFYQDSAWALPLALAIAGAVSFATDRMFKPKPGVQNALFFIPMKWWAPLLAIIAIIVLLYRSLSGAAPA